jgi:hypothetical protein
VHEANGALDDERPGTASLEPIDAIARPDRQSSTPSLWLLDRPVKPGDDSDQIERRTL